MIKLKDKLIAKVINSEENRQMNHIELIASENYVSEDVLKATGSILTNKYAEGYVGRRYYNGCEYIDQVEQIAKDRLQKLFNVKYVNVQPHSGSSANAAAIAAMIEIGDKIMGLSLTSGGHLTHGYKINFSGKFYKTISYDVDKQGFLDYEAIKVIALKEKPDLIICGYSAYSRIVDFKKFREIADACGAKLMADIAHIAGLVATGLHPSPVGVADVITSTTHKTLRGVRGGIIMTNDLETQKLVNKWVFPGYQGGPLMHAIAGKAVTFHEALQPTFKAYINNVVQNSQACANEFLKQGAKVITGGTDNHLFIINVSDSFGITGKEAANILQTNNIIVNKNTIPNDRESPTVTSGLRIGTAAMTSRGFNEEDFRQLARIVVKVIKHKKSVKKEVAKLLSNHPIIKNY